MLTTQKQTYLQDANPGTGFHFLSEGNCKELN
jgi:hypothetical protein